MINFKEWFYLVEARKPAEIVSSLYGQELLKKLQEIIPAGVREDEKGKYLLTAAHFYVSQRDLAALGRDLDLYKRLVIANKMKLFSFDDNGLLNAQFREYSDYLAWTAAMHGMEYDLRRKEEKKYKPSEDDLARIKPIFVTKDGTIKVYEALSAADAIILGRGTTFCISQPGNTMYKSYRDQHVATFYFVYDSNRTDDLDIVVVDVGKDKHSGRDVIFLTDRPNMTGTCQNPEDSNVRDSDAGPYLNYLKRMGVDTTIFKNRPLSQAEQEEENLLGRKNNDLNWFVALSPEQKSGYIGRGYILTDAQFDFVMKNYRSLLEQYVSTGQQIDDYQFGKIKKDSDLIKKYFHNRNIAISANPYQTWTKNEVDEIIKRKGPIYDELVNKTHDFVNGLKKENGNYTFYESWLNDSQKYMLKHLYPDIYQDYLVYQSNTGMWDHPMVSDDEIGDLEDKNFDRLNASAQMKNYLMKGENQKFKKLYSNSNNRYIPISDEHSQNYYVFVEALWLLEALKHKNYEIADYIIDSVVDEKDDNLRKESPFYNLESKYSVLTKMAIHLLNHNRVGDDIKKKYLTKLVDNGAIGYQDIYLDMINNFNISYIDIFLDRYKNTSDTLESYVQARELMSIADSLDKQKFWANTERGTYLHNLKNSFSEKIKNIVRGKQSKDMMALHADEIEDRLSGVGGRKGKDSWKNG